jgi:hypothetical protein
MLERIFCLETSVLDANSKLEKSAAHYDEHGRTRTRRLRSDQQFHKKKTCDTMTQILSNYPGLRSQAAAPKSDYRALRA